MKELGIYLHFPFCVKKCRYCDFLSAPGGEEVRERYVQALLTEIEEAGRQYQAYAVGTMFFGGGTPSLLTEAQAGRILEALRRYFRLAGPWKSLEVTLECNPGTVTREKLTAYKRAGVNRLSIGLQSCDREELKCLGRIHTYEDFLETYQSAREAGFSNINVDLMSALPGQTMESYQNTLDKVLALRPEHISAYSLQIEEGTPFYELYQKGLLRLPEEEEERLMYEETKRRLEKAGYFRYEISNYARPGYICRHNEAYWIRKEYVGLGLGAASLVDNVRFKNVESLNVYLSGGFRKKQEVQALSFEEQMEEFMFLGLRLMRGISGADFQRQFGRTLEEVYGPVLEELLGQGLVETAKNDKKWERVRLTDRGIDVSNVVLSRFLLS